MSILFLDPWRRFRDVAYLRLSRDRMELDVFRGRPLKRALNATCAPVAVVERRGDRLNFLALGDEDTQRWKFKNPNSEIVQLFDHPRVLVAKAEAIEAVGHFLKRHVRRWPLGPIMVMHQTDCCDGGLSVMESRMFDEIGVECLGGRVFILGVPGRLDVSDLEDIAQI